MKPVPAQTLNFGPVYQAEVGTAFTQTYNSPLASARVARAASPFSGVSRVDDSDEDYAFDIEGDDGGGSGDDSGSIFSPPSPPPADSIPEIPAPIFPAQLSAAAVAKSSTPVAGVVTKHALALTALTATYNSQTPSHRWHLTSSRTVETVLYESCLGMDAPTFLTSLAPSFILDVSDTTMMQGLFTGPEREEIMSAVPDMPTADIKMVKSLVRFFPAKTTADVREVLAKTSFLDEGEVYDREKHFDACWADLVVRLMYVPLTQRYWWLLTDGKQPGPLGVSQRSVARKAHGGLVHELLVVSDRGPVSALADGHHHRTVSAVPLPSHPHPCLPPKGRKLLAARPLNAGTATAPPILVPVSALALTR